MAPFTAEFEANSEETGSGRGKGRRRSGEPSSRPSGRRKYRDRRELFDDVAQLRVEMLAAAKNLDFELAAQIRDEVFRLEQLELEIR